MIDRKNNNFISDTGELIRQSKEIKNFQQIGQDTYTIYTHVSTAQTYNLNTSTYRIKDTVTFTADHQSNAFAELNYVRYVGSVSPGNEDKFYGLEIVKKVSSPNSKTTEWEVGILNPSFINVTFIVYYYVLSYDNGVISV